MRFPFEARRRNGIPFQSNIPGRTFRNPPHPENATHYSAKTGSRFPKHSMQRGHKECPNCRQKKNVPKCRLVI